MIDLLHVLPAQAVAMNVQTALDCAPHGGATAGTTAFVANCADTLGVYVAGFADPTTGALVFASAA